ncbi:HAMP domain-containing histidine kinase [Puniceicoccaceae bacterium K14]|nr:HAMP domain-containing histidine kinase [Puniceicoccaceae bacterium K14]
MKLWVFYILILLTAVWMVTNQRYSVKSETILNRAIADAKHEAEALQFRFQLDGLGALESELIARLDVALTDKEGIASERYYKLEEADGTVRLGNTPSWESDQALLLSEGVYQLVDVPRPGAPRVWELTWLLEGNYNPDYDLVLVEVILEGGYRLFVGRDTEFWNEMHVIFKLSTWCLACVSLLALVAGLLANRRLLRNLSRINRLAHDIVRTRDLSKRIPVVGERSEFSETITNLNLMLGKIEESVANLREASNSIAHDMRMPLTRLRNRLEDIVKEGQPIAADEVATLVEEVDSLLSTFRSILRISQLELNPEGLELSDVNLSALVQDAAELYAPVCAAKGQVIEVDASPVVIKGEANLLFQLVSNLLDNACKYSPKDSVIKCGVKPGEAVTLSVKDAGSGIPTEERERVFERFYRMEKSRANDGVGLGLSMVLAIAKAHGAKVELDNASPGLYVQISFS